jgi:signal transduction histidine kinase
MPRGGVLRIRIKPSKDWRSYVQGLRITVGDTGCGMSPETLRHIYDPFFTAKGAFGTGLGLWVSAGILAKHEGSIHVRSCVNPQSSGTVFTMIFPHLETDETDSGSSETD